ncbi:hypothetical protein UlMin_040842 [Ulmus minor]
MAQIGNMEYELEVKCSAQRFYQIFRSRAHLLPKLCPNVVKDIQVIKGGWDAIDSVKRWIFLSGNSSEVSIDTVEAVDEKNKSMIYKVIGGEVAKHYNSFKFGLEAKEKRDGGCLVKWIVQYEKENENIPAPNEYKGLGTVMTMCIDAYLLNNA